MKRDKIWAPLTAFVLVCVVALTNANAEIVTFTDKAAWEAALSGAATLEDFESAGTDINSGTVASPVTFNDLKFGTNANFFSNASIQLDPYIGNNAAINGSAVFDLNFLDYKGSSTAPEFVEVTLPTAISAFSFIYRNGDSGGDGAFLTVDGVAIDGFDGFDAFDARYDNATGEFFGVVDTTGLISTFRFTAKENLGSSGTTTFNSFDDVRYGVSSVPEPSGALLFATALFGFCGLRRRK